MKLTEFEKLGIDEQVQIAQQEAVFIGSRGEENLIILLFRVYSFYVEVYYRNDSSDIQLLKSFDDPTLLEPYMEK